ncbi:MAG: transcriptional regulator, HxlR family [Capsulimonas sp.]|jgi:DNA-binding HxlR family transcriptional regulator|nr:transcriptional regulator, HxlR family [Capsulimonas sp.]
MKTMLTGCPAERTLAAVGGRWKIFILEQLFGGTVRFSELQRTINGVISSNVTPKMLTQELRQMEANGLIHREVYAQVPPKVEYSLTPLGMSLRPVVEAMIEWGRQHEMEMDGSFTPCTPNSVLDQ